MQPEPVIENPVHILPAGSPALVLVVDDEEPNRDLLRDQLEVRGHEIREAENGEQALQCVAERPPDLILLDVMMPGMDGFEVCRRLKRDRRTAPIPILMVTALSERQERLMGIRAGANDFLNKPVDLHDLALRVDNALLTKRLYDQLQIEQQKSERLLLNILPESVARRMKNGETTIAEQHPEATVLVADLVGFTTLLEQISPREVVFLLNEIFSCFDLLVEQAGLEKIKTVGDAYIVAGGVNSTVPNSAGTMAELSLNMLDALHRFNEQYDLSLRMRIAISTGPVISGVIGNRKFAYDIWGAAVNLACHLGAVGAPGTIQVDESTFERLADLHHFSAPRDVELKNSSTVPVRTLVPRAFSQTGRLKAVH